MVTELSRFNLGIAVLRLGSRGLYLFVRKISLLQSARFTHERSWNEDCILLVRIPFFNWMTVFL